MSGDRSNRRRDNQPNFVIHDGKAIVPPSKRFLKWVKSETGARTLFRPSKEPVHIKKPGRNDPCPCGSGKKFKSCHGKEADSTQQSERLRFSIRERKRRPVDNEDTKGYDGEKDKEVR